MEYIDLNGNLNKDKRDFKGNSKYVESVENSIINIISTYKGTVPGHPEFGCKLDKFIFELINPLVLALIEEEVRYSLTRWERRIKIIQIKATEDMDYNRLNIYIKYSIIADIKGRVYDFTYKQKLE